MAMAISFGMSHYKMGSHTDLIGQWWILKKLTLVKSLAQCLAHSRCVNFFPFPAGHSPALPSTIFHNTVFTWNQPSAKSLSLVVYSYNYYFWLDFPLQLPVVQPHSRLLYQLVDVSLSILRGTRSLTSKLCFSENVASLVTNRLFFSSLPLMMNHL